MSEIELRAGDTIAGLIVSGAGSPLVGATVRMADDGLYIEVPYAHDPDSTQFDHVDEWFGAQSLPENLLLRTTAGGITLFGCRFRGHKPRNGWTASSGRLEAQEALLDVRGGPLEAPLDVRKCRSRADELNGWSRIRSVAVKPHRNEDADRNALTLNIEAPEAITWKQGGATLRFVTAWGFSPKDDGYSRSYSVPDNVAIESEWTEPRPFVDHLVEHRKVTHLLSFMFGSRIMIREHRVQLDDLERHGSHPFVELISWQTVREREEPLEDHRKRRWPMLALEDIGPDGLESWADHYAEWERFILPAVGVIGRKKRFIEDVVSSTSMSIEAAGHLIGMRPGEERTYARPGKLSTATHVYRCLDYLSVRWGPYIHSQSGLAHAIANNYNTIKHPDRGPFPDHVETMLVGQVNELIVRLIAATLTGSADGLLAKYQAGSELWDIQQAFEVNGIRIADDKGTWTWTGSGA